MTFPQGGEVRSPLDGDQAPGFPVRVGPGGRVRITFDGSYRVDPLVAGQSTAAATSYRDDPCAIASAVPDDHATPTCDDPDDDHHHHDRPAALDGPRRQRARPGAVAPTELGGVIVIGVGGARGRRRDGRGRPRLARTGESSRRRAAARLRLVNVVDVEEYLRGMAEVPGTWPAAAVQAQAVAARTYALRATQASGELCDDARCQVYVGRTAETAGQDAAVAATARRVLAYNGALAAAVYSADAGGVSATTMEGFGTPDGVYPYLTTVRYDTDNPLPWHLDGRLRRPRRPPRVPGERHRRPGGKRRSERPCAHDGARGLQRRAHRGRADLRAVAWACARPASPPRWAPPTAPRRLRPPAEEALQLLPTETAAAARTAIPRPGAGSRLDRRAPDRDDRGLGRGRCPDALDPRQHILTLAGGPPRRRGSWRAHVPLALAGGSPAIRGPCRGHVRPWRPWRLPTRSR